MQVGASEAGTASKRPRPQAFAAPGMIPYQTLTPTVLYAVPLPFNDVCGTPSINFT